MKERGKREKKPVLIRFYGVTSDLNATATGSLLPCTRAIVAVYGLLALSFHQMVAASFPAK
ncbi:hypothetical protein TRIATDRAFT_258822 [Trichoderma atroviride IMI 206040]|uniref:Uncharacterized protein n=1 Tax=Hypocrea atroviridis (strain ATCC 20476 / IMI 206040) TaxID=452589 RepID=G9P6W3_HYPAI|nr:uncharacterized protein TRIATDRAFT_258822 [Trichoderma atroviride IMI 206040]EHK40689.1 hypothetical protein TRIATDRAFT_258822 [Trichoderma atroviride IMI 206040]